MAGKRPTPERLATFSDGVIAIIITIMVLELKVPHEPNLRALGELWPVFLSYALSYLFVGVFWANHHHLLRHAKDAEPTMIWANLGRICSCCSLFYSFRSSPNTWPRPAWLRSQPLSMPVFFSCSPWLSSFCRKCS